MSRFSGGSRAEQRRPPGQGKLHSTGRKLRFAFLRESDYFAPRLSGAALAPGVFAVAAGECPSLRPLLRSTTHLRFAGGTVLHADTRANGPTEAMIEVWKQWEGQVADGRFLLRQYLGAS